MCLDVRAARMHTFSPGLFNVGRHVNEHTWTCRDQALCEMHVLPGASCSQTLGTVLHHTQFWAYCIFNPLVPHKDSEERIVLLPDLPSHTSTSGRDTVWTPVVWLWYLDTHCICHISTHAHVPTGGDHSNINRIVSMSISGWWVFERLFTFSFLLTCILNPVQRRCTFF